MRQVQSQPSTIKCANRKLSLCSAEWFKGASVKILPGDTLFLLLLPTQLVLGHPHEPVDEEGSSDVEDNVYPHNTMTELATRISRQGTQAKKKKQKKERNKTKINKQEENV